MVRLHPKRGHTKELIRWVDEISFEASMFEGHLSSDLFSTVKENTSSEFIVVIHFDTKEHLQIWGKSKQHRHLIRVRKSLFEEVKPNVMLVGLQYWFEQKRKEVRQVPRKWKMMIITVVIIYGMFNTLIPWLRSFFLKFGWPTSVTSLLSIILMVTLMTYLIMPVTNKLLADWLKK